MVAGPFLKAHCCLSGQLMPRRSDLVTSEISSPFLTQMRELSAYSLHHSKQIWGDDADSFRPDRWLEPGAEELDKYFIPVSMFNLASVVIS